MVAGSRNKVATSAEAQMDRLIVATGAKNEAGLAKVLGKSHQALYNAKKKGIIPANWILDVAEECGASADWLRFGIGNMKRGAKDSSQNGLAPDMVSVVIEIVEEILDSTNRRLPPNKKAELIVTICELYSDSAEAVDPAKVLRLVKLAS